MNPYEEVLYPGYVHPQTHPDRMRVIGRLFGMNPAKVTGCRVLELGCGNGSNLVPMASTLPGSEFVGIDLAANPVALGTEMISDLGLKNVRLVHGNITEVDADWGKFDFIIAHGLYSWIPAKVRDHLLAICRACLAPEGIAFVSYSTYPGGHLPQMLREMMLFHVRGLDQGEKVQQAKCLLSLLANAGYGTDEYRQWMKAEVETVMGHEHGHLFHDELAEINEPLYFTEFVSQAARHDLQYLSEADFFETSDHIIAPGVREVLRQTAHDRILRDQYLDFIKCRRFRQTLLCHREAPLSGEPDWRAIADFRISSSARCQSSAHDRSPNGSLMFQTAKGAKVETDYEPGKAALLLLEEAWPSSLHFSELAVHVGRQVEGIEETGRQWLDFVGDLCRFFLQIYSAGIVEFRTHIPPHASRAGERPLASAVARWQIQRGSSVTSLHHMAVQIQDEIGKQLLLLLDGTNDRNALLEKLLPFTGRNGASADKPASEPQHRSQLEADLERNLTKLARFGLLAT